MINCHHDYYWLFGGSFSPLLAFPCGGTPPAKVTHSASPLLICAASGGGRQHLSDREPGEGRRHAGAPSAPFGSSLRTSSWVGKILGTLHN